MKHVEYVTSENVTMELLKWTMVGTGNTMPQIPTRIRICGGTIAPL